MSARSPRSFRSFLPLPCVLLLAAATNATAGGADPFADAVVSYDPGVGGPPGYDDPAVALGSPERFTGEGVFPSVVSPFASAYGLDELVAIGAGGALVLAFDEPVTDDPANPFGIDLLVFGNAFFADAAFPSGVVGALFGEGGTIEVSADGATWVAVPGASADGGWPTLGWLDAGPYDEVPGRVPSDFTRPIDPGLGFADFDGVGYPELLALYDGSGGGAGVDLADVGLSEISFVRLSLAEGVDGSIEIDAVSDVAPDDGGPAADLDGDGDVDFEDLLVLLAAWGPCDAACPEDLDGTGAVDFEDLLVLLASWS